MKKTDTCEDCGRPKWDGGNALNVRECGARGSGTCQGFTEARRLRAELAAAKEEAKAFRALKRAWYDNGVSEAEWLEFCQDFDWTEPFVPACGYLIRDGQTTIGACEREVGHAGECQRGSPKRPNDSDT